MVLAPDAAQFVKDFLGGLPYNQLVALTITEVDEGRARGSLPFRPELGNHIGTMHAAAQFGLIEATSGAAVAAGLADLLLTVTPLAQGAEVSYKATARGNCTAEAIIAPDELTRMRSELASEGKTRVKVPVTLTDAGGTEAMLGTVNWYVRANRT